VPRRRADPLHRPAPAPAARPQPLSCSAGTSAASQPVRSPGLRPPDSLRLSTSCRLGRRQNRLRRQRGRAAVGRIRTPLAHPRGRASNWRRPDCPIAPCIGCSMCGSGNASVEPYRDHSGILSRCRGRTLERRRQPIDGPAAERIL
jgi:hypothetical protein